MNAVKISVLLIAFYFLFTAVPCFAAAALPYGQTPALSLETVSEDNANLPRGYLEPIGNSTQIGNASEHAWATEAIYSIDAHVKHPEINPGQAVEIEVYLSGYGIPEKSKLMIIWSSPYVIDDNDPGKITRLIGYVISDGNFTPLFEDVPLNVGDITGTSGAWVVPSLVTFEPAFALLPKDFPEDIGLKMVMGETNWNGNPPILVKLNTRKGASAGDYQVKFTFTYGNETNLEQDSEEVEFHVTSYWERNQRWYTIGLAVGIPLVIFVAGIMLRKRQAKNQKKRKR